MSDPEALDEEDSNLLGISDHDTKEEPRERSEEDQPTLPTMPRAQPVRSETQESELKRRRR
jgi:hypothetical protein